MLKIYQHVVTFLSRVARGHETIHNILYVLGKNAQGEVVSILPLSEVEIQHGIGKEIEGCSYCPGVPSSSMVQVYMDLQKLGLEFAGFALAVSAHNDAYFDHIIWPYHYGDLPIRYPNTPIVVISPRITFSVTWANKNHKRESLKIIND